MSDKSLVAIDPGTSVSGWVTLSWDNRITGAGVMPNEDVLDGLRDWVVPWAGLVAIERFEARGMAIGDDSIETIIWTGRFIQAAGEHRTTKVKRSDVKLHLCGTTAAKDPNIRAALIDIFGPKGTKAEPGPTFGVATHAWAALGVAATVRGLR